MRSTTRAVARGEASGARPPQFEIGASPFHVWPPGCCIHPTLYFLNVAPLLAFGPSFWFLAPLLLNPGDGHEYNYMLTRLSDKLPKLEHYAEKS